MHIPILSSQKQSYTNDAAKSLRWNNFTKVNTGEKKNQALIHILSIANPILFPLHLTTPLIEELLR